MQVRLFGTVMVAVYLVALGALLGAKAGQPTNPPPFPNTYSGNVFIGDDPAPDGIEVFARIGDYDTHVARPGFEDRQIVLTKDGGYARLVISPPGETFVGKTITFFATRGFDEIQASETAVFQRVNLATNAGLANTLDLHFPQAPSATPPRTPTPIPTITPTPLPTPVPPVPGDASVPQLARITLIAGAAALVVGGAIMLFLRRRQAL